MNDNDMKYRALIARIRSCEPELDGAEMLESRILSAVERPLPGPRIVLRVVGWASSIAAALLFALFLSEPPLPAAPPSQKGAVQLERENTELIIRRKKERIKRRAEIVNQYRKS